MREGGQAILDGMVGGLVATATMSACMAAASRVGLLGEPPPRRVASAALRFIGREQASGRWRNMLALAGHFGFGAGIGALFALGHHHLRAPVGPVPRALAFASGIWFISYQGWIPALGIMPPASRDRPARPATMLVAHWVYGATLGAYLGRSRHS